MRAKELFLVPVGEAALLTVLGSAGWVSHQPLLFTSLGPTAYELIETPHRRSAQPYSVIAGHLIAILAGFLALYLTGAWKVAPVSAAGVLLPRVWAAALAAGMTVAGTLALKASQPAALSTTLLISLGTMQKPVDAVLIMGAVLLMTAIGEPLRILRLKSQRECEEQRRTESHSDNPPSQSP